MLLLFMPAELIYNAEFLIQQMPCIQFLVDCRSVRIELDGKLLLCTIAAVKSNCTFLGCRKLHCSSNVFVSGVLM